MIVVPFLQRMKILQNNPAIIQTNWEPLGRTKGKKCYLIAAAQRGDRELKIAEVTVKDKYEGETMVAARLDDLRAVL